MNIKIYSSAQCHYCELAKRLLKDKGLAFEEIRVDESPEKLEEMLALSNGIRTVPQIFFDERHIGGYTELAAMYA